MTFVSIAAKVFPGQLTIQNFREALTDKTSEEFKMISEAVAQDVSFSFCSFVTCSICL